MKKLLAFSVLAGTLAVVSCSKEGVEPLQNKDRIKIISGQSISDELKPMNETFTIQGKNTSLTYTYRAFAESPIINGVQTAATSITRRGDRVYVTWHTPGADFGGAVSAYAYDDATKSFSYLNRADFVDSDWHDLDASTGSTGVVYLAGARNPDASGYSHGGAVLGRLPLGTPGLTASAYTELPLRGFAANGVAFESGSNIHVGTGDADGYIYKTNFSLDRLDSNFRDNVEHLAGNGSFFAALKGSQGPNGGDVEVYRYPVSGMSTSPGASVLGWTGASSTGVDRNAISFYNDRILTALDNGLVEFDFGSSSINVVANLPGQARGVGADVANQLVYLAGGEGGLFVLNGPDVAGTPYEVQGAFTPPTGGPFQANFDVKDVVIEDENVFIAVGSGGVFFVTRD